MKKNNFFWSSSAPSSKSRAFASHSTDCCPSKELYEGQYNKRGRRHGQGKATFTNGSVYDGSWQDGIMHGQGSFSYKSGNVYEGAWKKGIRHGRGKLFLANGDEVSHLSHDVLR